MSVAGQQALAYTSKRPGKTQQFNYFMMNNNTENAFYLVDMPGMGYAKVSPETHAVDKFPSLCAGRHGFISFYCSERTGTSFRSALKDWA